MPEQPATEQPATEQPATEQPATEQPATEQPATEPDLVEPSRRALLAAGAVAAAVGATSLAGCGSSSSAGGSRAAASTAAGTGGSASPSPSPSPSSSPSSSQSESAGGGVVLAPLASVPVGGSAANGSGSIVIAQPTAGHVVAFSSKCTHRGCTVAPAGMEYHCPCHGSVYDAFTGAVKSGPAPAPLSKVSVTVTGGNVVESS